MQNQIGISEDKLHHILGVARECYRLSVEMGYSETFAQKMFTIGWNHDIGYEFATTPKDHPEIGIQTLIDTFDCKENTSIDAILKHGKQTEDKTIEWLILNLADLTIDHKGNKVTIEERLASIQERYGTHSHQYQNSSWVSNQVTCFQEEDSFSR